MFREFSAKFRDNTTRMSKNKAPEGETPLKKHTTAEFVNEQAEIDSVIWEGEEISEDCIVQEEGGRKTPSSLEQTAGKQLDGYLGEYQAGFREGRSRWEQILNLKNTIAYMKMSKKSFVLTFLSLGLDDCIDRATLANILGEMRLDKKLHAQLQKVLSKKGEESNAPEAETGIEPDRISPPLFNCLLEKAIRGWRCYNNPGVRLGRRKTDLVVDCLAFVNELVIISQSLQEAAQHVGELKIQAKKAGLQICTEKMVFMTNIKPSPRKIKTGEDRIKKVEKFKFLEEWIEPSNSEKCALEARRRQLETTFNKAIQWHKRHKKPIPANEKLRLYKTARPKVLSASECLALKRRVLNANLELAERKILRKILGIRNENGRFRSNKELYEKTPKITDVMRKRRLRFFADINGMEKNRLTYRIVAFLQNKKIKGPWLNEVQKDLEEIGLSGQELKDKETIKKKLKSIRGFQEKDKFKTGGKWTEERRKAQSERMKEYWRKVKEGKIKRK